MEQDGVVSLIENRSLTTDEIGVLAGLITDEPDHYTVLGVNRNASSEEIQSAYCLAVEHFHPLKSRKITDSDSVMHWKLSSAFLRIEEAFTVLSRRSRRKVYDDNLGLDQVQAAPQQDLDLNAGSRQFGQSEWPDALGPRLEASQSRESELRRVERVLVKVPMRVSFERYWQELTESMDVSPLGIRFRLSHTVEPGSELRIELPMPKHLRTHSYDDDVYVARAFVIYTANYDGGRQVVAEFI